MRGGMHSDRALVKLGTSVPIKTANSTSLSRGPDSPVFDDARGASIAGRNNCQDAHGEVGAILILALVYIFTVGLIVAALASWATNDLNNTTHFTTGRSLQYALSSVTETAIQSMRYNPIPTTTPPGNVATPVGYCWTPTSGYSYDGLVPVIDGENVAVWCSTVENLSQGTTRVVTFSACMSTVTTGAACAATPLLQVVVSYDDYPPGGGPLLSSQCTPTVNCGEGMTLENWTWSTQSS
jgi:hypothetical protein